MPHGAEAGRGRRHAPVGLEAQKGGSEQRGGRQQGAPSYCAPYMQHPCAHTHTHLSGDYTYEYT